MTTTTPEKKKTIQDNFLNYVRKNKTPVTIFLSNGVKLQGIVTGFDIFVIALKKDLFTQLVYKHAVSTILPNEPIKLYSIEDEDTPVDAEKSD